MSASIDTPPDRRRHRRDALLVVAALLSIAVGAGVIHERRQRRAASSVEVVARVGGVDGGAERALAVSTGRGGLGDGGMAVAAGPVDGRGVLAGMVLLDGKGVGGARVSVSGATESEVLTDERGHFVVDGLAPGRHALRALGDDAAAYLGAVDVAAQGPNPALQIALGRAQALVGRVLDDAGAALDGATVSLAEGEFAPLPRVTRSVGTGEFRFPSVLPGTYRLAVTAPGRVGASATLRFPSLEGPAVHPVVRLARAATLLGSVDDEQGRAVAGATVSVLAGEGWALSTGMAGAGGPLVEPAGELGIVRGPIPFPPLEAPAPLPSAAAATGAAMLGAVLAGGAHPVKTDAAGRFRVEGLPAGRVVAVVSQPAFADGRSAEVVLAAGGEGAVRVTLRRALSVRGRVVDGHGAAAPGAELWVGGALVALCDRQGRFELQRLAGPVEVEVRARGHAPSARHLDPNLEPVVELVVGAEAQRITGVVVDARGLAVAGAEVSCDGIAGERLFATSSRSGEFVLSGGLRSPSTLRVKHGQHQRASVSGVQPGDDVRVTLLPGGVLEGEVGGDRGGVVAGVRITVKDAGEQILVAELDATGSKGRSGRFRVQGLSPGTAVVTAEAPGYVSSVSTVELGAAETTGEVVMRDLRIALAEAGAVEGRVRDDHGQAVRDADVECAGQHARSDGTGRFRLAAVPIGRMALRASASSGAGEASTFVERGRSVTVDLVVR